jgi:hypothetical protein
MEAEGGKRKEELHGGCWRKEEWAPWRLRESGDLMEPEDREWIKWKKVDIEPRLETGDARR